MSCVNSFIGSASCFWMKERNASADLWPRYSRFKDWPFRITFRVGYLVMWNLVAIEPVHTHTNKNETANKHKAYDPKVIRYTSRPVQTAYILTCMTEQVTFTNTSTRWLHHFLTSYKDTYVYCLLSVCTFTDTYLVDSMFHNMKYHTF